MLVVVVVVVSHIRRSGCQLEKLLNTVANPACGLLNRERKKERKKEKSDSASPPPPALLVRGKYNKNHATHLHA